MPGPLPRRVASFLLAGLLAVPARAGAKLGRVRLRLTSPLSGPAMRAVQGAEGAGTRPLDLEAPAAAEFQLGLVPGGVLPGALGEAAILGSSGEDARLPAGPPSAGISYSQAPASFAGFGELPGADRAAAEAARLFDQGAERAGLEPPVLESAAGDLGYRRPRAEPAVAPEELTRVPERERADPGARIFAVNAKDFRHEDGVEPRELAVNVDRGSFLMIESPLPSQYYHATLVLRVRLRGGEVVETPAGEAEPAAGFRHVYLRSRVRGRDVTRIEWIERPAGAPERRIGAYAVRSAAPERTAREGGPWLDFIARRLRPGDPVLSDRAALFGLLRGLFSNNMHPAAVLEAAERDPGLAVLLSPGLARPGIGATRRLLALLRRRWGELGLERLHGSIDAWLARAVDEIEAPETFVRNVRLIAEGAPRAAMVTLKQMPLHMLRFEHPLEPFGDRGRLRRGYVDLELSVELLPQVVSHALDLPAGVERDYALWVIASNLNQDLYRKPHNGRDVLFKRYWPRVQAGLAGLGRPREVAALLEEIRGKDAAGWERLGFRHPWMTLQQLEKGSEENVPRTELLSRFLRGPVDEDDPRAYSPFGPRERWTRDMAFAFIARSWGHDDGLARLWLHTALYETTFDELIGGLGPL